MGRKFNYDFLDCARSMPKLKHRNGSDYDISKSEVCKWLIRQPEIQQKVFDMAMNAKVIAFDVQSKEWKGVDYEAGVFYCNG